MTSADREFLLHRLNETRSQIEALLPKIDPKKEIYPGWTIKDMLAHITGWDDATIDSLRAHVAGRLPATPAERGIDEYNGRTVTSRQDLDYPHILNEWRLTRQVLQTIIEQMPDEKFFEPLVVPWGDKGTVTYLVDTFRDHEDEHARDIREWLKDPSQPLGKRGN
ncbi:MAG TPA: ClbS/DfsB family four-helix bundle protein [Anaerolineales bacterium]|nr:ClbS/DfsB family four-helix bundle protein [Anaerolineales bacterium]